MPNRRGGAASVTVYYNGACPLCRAEISHYRSMARARRSALVWVDVSRDPGALARRGGWTVDPYRRLHVVDRNENLLEGLEAFRSLWRELPPLNRLAGLAGAPVIRPIATWLYDDVVAPLLWRRQQSRVTTSGAAAP